MHASVSPITLFAYARADHVRRTVEALLLNPEAATHDLIVFSDAARSSEKQAAVYEVRAYLATITGFRSVTIHYRSNNFGLAKSIIEGVTQVLSEHDRIIVLEDDMVTSPHFLAYMNEALDRFNGDERVISIHGYVYPVQQALPEAFFLPGADCWGWATWRRGWRLFNPDGQALLQELKRRELIYVFDFNGAYRYSKMLEGQVKGTNDSWAVRWYASAFLAGKFTLYPGRSLVHNIGIDASGTHCNADNSYDAELSATPINLSQLDVTSSVMGRAAFETFFRKTQANFVGKLGRRIKDGFYQGHRKSFKTLAKDCLPPIVVRAIRSLRGGGIRFEGNYPTWEAAAAQCTGYDAAPILAKVLEATLKVKQGEAAYERDSVLFNEIEYTWPVTAALMWAAAQSGGRLDVLDFGGALGSRYFENRSFLANLPMVRWSVVEQAHYVDAGRKYIQDETLRFYSSIDDCLIDNKPNVALLSSVLQYLPEINTVVAKICAAGPALIIIDRTIINYSSATSIYMQKVPASIYAATYPCRSISEKELLSQFSQNYKVEMQFPSLSFQALNKIKSVFNGYILSKVSK